MGPEIAVYVEGHDAVYVEIPKVACTSVKVALADMLAIDLGESGNPHTVAFPSPPAIWSKVRGGASASPRSATSSAIQRVTASTSIPGGDAGDSDMGRHYDPDPRSA